MRLKLIMSVISFVFINAVYSQSVFDSITILYYKYLIIESKSRDLEDSVLQFQQELNQIHRNYKMLNEELSSSLVQVNKLTKEDLLTKEGRLNNKKQKILQTASFVNAANNSFDAIEAALAQTDYLNDINRLNSPVNKDLGFSLQEKLNSLLETHIVKDGKINGSKADKFFTIVKSIVEHPISTAVSTSVPALSAINGVMSLVSSLSVQDKNISHKDYLNFQKSLDQYITHYESLAKASYDFNSNIENLKVKTDALRVILNNFVNERINTIAPGLAILNSRSINEQIRAIYNQDKLNNQIDLILNEHKDANGQINYQKALNDPRLNYPLYTINQAVFIQQELETITNEYISSYQKYHKAIHEILLKSKSISDEPIKIDRKKKALEQKLELMIYTFQKNVKITEVSENLHKIPSV